MMATRVCSIDGCQAVYLARGLCSKHYQASKRRGDFTPAPRPPGRYGKKPVPMEARFWPKVHGADPLRCWIWTGCIGSDGYGSFRREPSRSDRAHRVAYELLIGEIPDGLVLDHLCHDDGVCPGGSSCPHRACVNPWHLDPVPLEVNIQRGRAGEYQSRPAA